MRFKCKASGLVAGATMIVALSVAGAAQADDGNLLSWSSASASVGLCQVGVTCGQPNGVSLLARRQSTDTDVDFNAAAVGPQDYLQFTNNSFFGNAFSSAEAGEGLLGLPQLHAFAESRSVGLGFLANPYIGVDVAFVQAVQAYTNTSTDNLLIPLNAFQGLVDYHVNGAPGTVTAGLAITTSAILDPSVAALWSAIGSGSQFGQFTAGCGTDGALAIGSPSPANASPSPNTQYLGVAATSCTGSDTYLLAPNETFYVWARLGVVHTAAGVTDAANTFNVTIAPQYQQQVMSDLAPALLRASGANLDIPVAGVPEPGTWSLLILGFGAVGVLMRRRNARLGMVSVTS
jgi:hypothetical protein